MIYRVKNHRLFLENQSIFSKAKVKNLSEIPLSDLISLARKYQVDTSRISRVEVADRVGPTNAQRLEISDKVVIAPKDRRTLENDIRRYLTITVFIPKEFWTEEQRAIFISRDTEKNKDYRQVNDIYREMNVLFEVPPFEETKDMRAQAMMLLELDEEKWKFLQDQHNFQIKLVRDEINKTVEQKRDYLHRFMVVDRIPENEQDEIFLKEEADKKAKKKGIVDEPAE